MQMIWFIAITFMTSSASAGVFYISPNGFDSNSGSLSSPWKTLRKAAATLLPGDTGIVMDGTYEESEVLFQRSGTAAQRITLKAQNKHQAILSSTSSCAPNISLYASYITIEDLRIAVSPNNPTCASPSSTSSDGVRCWSGTDPRLGGQSSSGYVGCIVRGVRIDPSPLRGEGVKTNQDASLVENSEIYSGIEALNTTGTIFRNNVITGGDRWGNSIVAKGGLRNFQAYGNVIRFSANWGFGIVIGGATGTQWVFDPATGLEAYNSVAYNNIVIDQTGGNGTALSMRGAKDSAFFNNVVINGNLGISNGYSATASVNPTFKNNIVICGGKPVFGILNYTGTLSVDHNNFHNCMSVPSQARPITGDPQFVNAASDWHLKAGSLAIGSGAILTFAAYGAGTIDVSRDKDGALRTAPWDLGVYESGSAVAPPPPPPPPTGCSLTTLSLSGSWSDGGFATAIGGTFGTAADNASSPTQSTLRLFENGVEMGPAHSSHSDIRSLGLGRFSHWSNVDGSGESIRFSASNNSNPTTNGRTYAYCISSGAPSAFDLNRDGAINVADVQIAVNQALALSACTSGDTNGDGLCNVSDVQRVVNASLGI